MKNWNEYPESLIENRIMTRDHWKQYSGQVRAQNRDVNRILNHGHAFIKHKYDPKRKLVMIMPVYAVFNVADLTKASGIEPGELRFEQPRVFIGKSDLGNISEIQNFLKDKNKE